MRYAMHIAVHDNPHLFGALAASLRHESIDIYVHVDAKSAQEPFERAAERAGATVTFVPEHRRVRVQWGGLSQVRATFAMLDLAAGSGVPYHRHTLLSGADVLLRPLPQLLAALATDDEYLRIERRLVRSESQCYLKPRRYWLSDQSFPGSSTLSGRIPRRPPAGLTLLEGSNWWSLTDTAIGTVRDYLTAHPQWWRAHRYTLCPDEIIFHSILAASPLAGRITQNYVDREPDDHLLHGLHFIDWSTWEAIRPPDLTEETLQIALAGPAVFARKVGADWTWRAPAC